MFPKTISKVPRSHPSSFLMATRDGRRKSSRLKTGAVLGEGEKAVGGRERALQAGGARRVFRNAHVQRTGRRARGRLGGGPEGGKFEARGRVSKGRYALNFFFV